MKSPIENRQSKIASPLPPFIRELRDAIRAGQKTVTRRVVKPQPNPEYWETPIRCELYHPTKMRRDGEMYPGPEVYGFANEDHGWPCPYGQPGDVKYLREPLQNVNGWMQYADDNAPVRDSDGDSRIWRKIDGGNIKRNTLPQIHMPAAAARTFVQITAISVERVQAITEADALAEGITRVGHCYQPPGNFYPGTEGGVGRICGSARLAFQELWDTINAKRDGGRYAWAQNPFVWTLTFQLTPNP